MARLAGILGLAIFLLIGAAACEQQTPQQQNNQAFKQAVQKAAQAKNKAVSDETTADIWPPLNGNETVDIASELTTKNYYVVLDCSGSMGDRGCSGDKPKLYVAKESLGKFVNLVPEDANIGLMVFQNNRIEELIPLGKNNRDQFVKAVNNTSNSGGTPLFSAIRQGYFKLEAQGKKQLGYGVYTLVIVTDGAANEGQEPTEIVHWILDNSPIQIHTIGFCIGPNHSLNIRGRTVYKAANNPEQLDKGLQDVLAESENFDISDFNMN